MKYLEKIKFADSKEIDYIGRETPYLYSGESYYPYNLFASNYLSEIDFADVTVLYGGNGSGKSTILNIIAEKINAERIAPYNTSELFQRFVSHCSIKNAIDDYGDEKILPNATKIITSDDVFDYMIGSRDNNADVVQLQKQAELEYESFSNKYKNANGKLVDTRQIEGLEEKGRRFRRLTKRKYMRLRAGLTFNSGSNGETAIKYFNKQLESDSLYLLDEPENSLSAERQIELAKTIVEQSKYFGCQFIISTHSPFILSIDGAKIYNLDDNPVTLAKWWELENVKAYYKLFKENEDKFKG